MSKTQKDWNKINKEAYENKGKSYDLLRPLALYSYLSKYFKKHLSNHTQKGSLLMDAGCGTGNSTHFLDKIANNCEIHGIEQAKKMVEVAKQKKFKNKTKFYNNPIEDIKAKRKYDYVQFFQVIHHFKDSTKAITAAKYALKKGGKIVFIDVFSDGFVMTALNKFYCKFLGQGNYYTRNYVAMENELKKQGFRVIKKATHPVLRNYGLLIAVKS